MTDHFDLKNGLKIQQVKESTKQITEISKQQVEITKQKIESETTKRNKNTALVVIAVSFLFFLGVYLVRKNKK